ncbi:RmlC-like cupin domain-containing protein [Tribonema minus]|uniref:RmlC-like cupin domain-containing protein n=1 Tax=Tribonema minus TaxID=303371 RepID=A0A835YLH7_9STRA|nr:RmlC-like cupin domain-containing protein [Tribonema minus]
MTSFKSRSADKVVLSRAQSEGVGATVRRSIGNHELRNFDPFLMLDEFDSGKPAGFPDHPHRGFETVTYMLEGAFEHEDFMGNRGKIGPGDLQWMTAGRGIVHSEMPFGDGRSHGLQLWVNLGSKDKMCEPAYQELKAEEIPEVSDGKGVSARVIAGTALGTDSPVYTRTPAHYVHYTMEPGSVLQHAIPAGWSAFLYTLKGDVEVGGSGGVEVAAHHTITLDGDGEGVEVKAGKAGADFVLICGKPHGEPIVQHGPFVMNTRAEIQQAMLDYQSGSNGFEGAGKWYSQIGLPITHADRRR